MFLTIARQYSRNFKEGRKCPNQFVGMISVANRCTSNPTSNESGNDFSIRDDTDSYVRPETPIIILILESPHKAEFDNQYPSPKPAAGNKYSNTGRIIREIFGEVCSIHDYLPNGEYPLVILNAIQYQCSLGKRTTSYRDKVFIECWSNFGKLDFKNELLKFYKPDDIIINACSCGHNKTKLRALVKESIKNIVTPTPPSILEVEHPSNWKRRKNIALKNGGIPNYSWKS